MALGKAVSAGLIAGAGLPLVFGPDPPSPWTMLAISRWHLPGFSMLWSWPAFCVTVLAAWALLKAAGERN